MKTARQVPRRVRYLSGPLGLSRMASLNTPFPGSRRAQETAVLVAFACIHAPKNKGQDIGGIVRLSREVFR